MNGGIRLSYYNYTIEVKMLQIYFVVSVILHLGANLFYLFIVYLFIYIYLFIYVFIHFIFIYLFIYYLGI